MRTTEAEEIRAARLAALAEEDFRRHFLLEEERLTPEDWVERARRGAESSDLGTFVALGGRELVGIVDGHLRDEATVEVGGMWVRPEQRSRGIGRRLLEVVNDWAATNGATHLMLWVVTSNRPALTLYERTGFSRVGDPQPAKTVADVLLQRMERRI